MKDNTIIILKKIMDGIGYLFLGIVCLFTLCVLILFAITIIEEYGITKAIISFIIISLAIGFFGGYCFIDYKYDQIKKKNKKKKK